MSKSGSTKKKIDLLLSPVSGPGKKSLVSKIWVAHAVYLYFIFLEATRDCPKKGFDKNNIYPPIFGAITVQRTLHLFLI